MTNAEYRAAEGISKSSLFKIATSPEHFKFAQDNPPEKNQNLIFGSAFHKCVLEPDEFDLEFAVCPICDKRTKEGKEIYAEFVMQSEGKDIISQDEYKTILSMRDSILKNKYAVALLTGQKEQSYFWVDDITGEMCKCRPDILTGFNGLNVISDLKSCNDAGTDSFTRDCLKYGYDLQVAMYKEGVKVNTGKEHQFIFIAVEKTEPYAVNVLQADEMFVRKGQELFRELLGIYHECKESGNWYGYNGFSGAINSLSLPAWLQKDYE